MVYKRYNDNFLAQGRCLCTFCAIQLSYPHLLFATLQNDKNPHHNHNIEKRIDVDWTLQLVVRNEDKISLFSYFTK